MCCARTKEVELLAVWLVGRQRVQCSARSFEVRACLALSGYLRSKGSSYVITSTALDILGTGTRASIDCIASLADKHRIQNPKDRPSWPILRSSRSKPDAASSTAAESLRRPLQATSTSTPKTSCCISAGDRGPHAPPTRSLI